MDFIVLLAKVLAAICLLGLAGGFATLPFREGRRFVLLLTPMFGLLILPLGVTLIYSSNRLSFQGSAIIATFACAALTIFTFVYRRPTRDDVISTAILLPIVAAIATWMFCASTIATGSPALLYIDGSDHGGYAHAADWILSHSISRQPILAEDRPYESWPVVMFYSDFRYSAYVAISLMAALTRTSGLFAFDPACAVAFTVGCLSVATVFARSKFTLVALSFCLLMAAWFELGRDGYFGKLLAYPSSLFLVGLFATSYRTLTQSKLIIFCCLAVGNATMHAGVITAFFLASAGSLIIVADAAFTKPLIREQVTHRFVALGAIALIALASGGMFARPLGVPGSPDGFYISWTSLFPHLFEIQNPTRDYFTISDDWLRNGVLIGLGFHIGLYALTLLQKNAVAASLAVAPLLIITMLIILDALGATSARYAAYQFTGIVFTYALCGLAWLFDSLDKKKSWKIAACLFLCVGLIGPRLPRVSGSLDTYVTHPPASQIFKLTDFDTIAAAVGQQPVLADIRDSINAITLLVELGRRGMNIQWSKDGWNAVVGYRQWPLPNYSAAPKFILSDGADQIDPQQMIFRGPQFKLRKIESVSQ
ncbi:hypothetical protein [Bradyrhizobium valentinum]|uniref:hypothetical protein n=1 Tax=Bradyrhizobium valentinum TaxID=1518501 RepID=UPI000AF17BAD|nr:hypothetical protein [Bradyrhizobium valentinum]